MSLTSVIRYVEALDSTATDGSGKTGLAFGDITAKYLVQGSTLTSLTTETITTLGTYQAPTSAAHIRIKELAGSDPTKGIYEIHFHNTQMADSGKKFWLFLSATGAKFQRLEVELLPFYADVKEIGGDAQSATDLKDFADTGYDPATHKVAGVVLADTTTTLTNLPAITNNWLTAAGIAASALNGKGDWNIGKTGYALSTAGVQAIWDALTSALSAVGSIGKLLVDRIDAAISSRSSFNAGSDTVTLADGAHGGTSATLRLGGSSSTPAFYVTNSAGDAVKFQSTGGDGHALYVLGNGLGQGMHVIGGANGSGIEITGGGTSGNGVQISTTDGDGIIITAGGTGQHGIFSTGGPSGDGMRLTAGTSGKALTAATIVGDITGNLSGSVGSLTTLDEDSTTVDLDATIQAALTAQGLTTARAGYLDELAAANLPADIDQIKADLPARITKNTALSNFPFLMVDETDGYTAETGLTITATRSIDGAAFGACTNSAAEIGSGYYKIDLAAGDLNGNTIVLKFSATGARTRYITIVTQPT